MTPASAVKAIERAGLLLVFPIANSPQFPSLWSHFFPRSKMRWEWDDAGDHRVADLWHLREELSRSGQVVYTKWFRGRATFFSRSLFPALIRSLHGDPPFAFGLKSEAETLLRLLEENSPLSTKQLKRASEMEGRFFESAFQRALKELWAHLLIVGYGEVDDGAFPSLAMGATSLLFEDLWREASVAPRAKLSARIDDKLSESSPFFGGYRALLKRFYSTP
jgi:hypothetical protein